MIWLDPANVNAFGHIIRETDSDGSVSMNLDDFMGTGK